MLRQERPAQGYLQQSCSQPICCFTQPAAGAAGPACRHAKTQSTQGHFKSLKLLRTHASSATRARRAARAAVPPRDSLLAGWLPRSGRRERAAEDSGPGRLISAQPGPCSSRRRELLSTLVHDTLARKQNSTSQCLTSPLAPCSPKWCCSTQSRPMRNNMGPVLC